jgi:hypothetical protein
MNGEYGASQSRSRNWPYYIPLLSGFTVAPGKKKSLESSMPLDESRLGGRDKYHP